MAEHQGKIKGFMIGVGTGFDYFAGNINCAPEWMQKTKLECVQVDTRSQEAIQQILAYQYEVYLEYYGEREVSIWEY